MRSTAQGARGLRAARALAAQVRDPRFRRFGLRPGASTFWEDEAVWQKSRDSKAKTATFTGAFAGAPGARLRRPAPGHRRPARAARSADRSAALANKRELAPFLHG